MTNCIMKDDQPKNMVIIPTNVNIEIARKSLLILKYLFIYNYIILHWVPHLTNVYALIVLLLNKHKEKHIIIFRDNYYIKVFFI